MGVVIALGAITMFGNYKDDVLSTTRVEDTKSVGNNLKQAILDLQGVNGSTTLKLQERVGGQDYKVAINNKITILSGMENYTTSLNGMENSYRFSGSAPGGPIKIYKRGKQYTLRPE